MSPLSRAQINYSAPAVPGLPPPSLPVARGPTWSGGLYANGDLDRTYRTCLASLLDSVLE